MIGLSFNFEVTLTASYVTLKVSDNLSKLKYFNKDFMGSLG